MAAVATVKIEEIGDIEGYLVRMEALVRTKALKNAIAAACKVVRDEAKRKCPVDTGALQKSISYVVRDYQDGQVVVGIVGPSQEQALKGYRVEFGHRVKISGSRGSERVRAQPFLRPAGDETAMDQEAAVIASLTADMKGLQP